MKDLSVYVLAIVVAVFGFLNYTKDSVVVQVQDGEQVSLGAFSGTDIYNDVVFYESVKSKDAVTAIATTTSGGNITLSANDSGTIYTVSATGTTFTLPAVTHAGTFYRFVAGGALDTANVVIDSAEGDNIEGTLIVAGAVVDCDAEDQINFVVDGENIGDYVEVYSNGTNWLIGDSGVLTTAKMTCTDPS